MPRIGLRIPGAQLDRDSLPFIQNLELAADTGYRAVEICPEDFDAIHMGILDQAATKKVAGILSRYSFDVSVHVPIALNLMNREFPELHFAVLLSCLEFTGCVGGRLLVFHPSRYVDNIEFARYGKAVLSDSEKTAFNSKEVELLRKAGNKFPEIMIAVENHRPYLEHSPYSYGEFPGEIASVVKAVGLPNVGMMIDTGHLNLSASYHKFEALRSVLDTGLKMEHIHINDNNGIPTFYTEKDKKAQLPFGRGDEHVPPGYGMIDFSRFFKSIPEFGGSAVIELTNHWFYPAKIRESFQYIEKIFSEIKKSGV